MQAKQIYFTDTINSLVALIKTLKFISRESNEDLFWLNICYIQVVERYEHPNNDEKNISASSLTTIIPTDTIKKQFEQPKIEKWKRCLVDKNKNIKTLPLLLIPHLDKSWCSSWFDDLYVHKDEYEAQFDVFVKRFMKLYESLI